LVAAGKWDEIANQVRLLLAWITEAQAKR
jgi:hypothetical protein